MPLTVNLHELSKNPVRLKGELPVAELELGAPTAPIQFLKPLKHDLVAEEMQEAILLQGKLLLELQCECVRCLKSFKQKLELPDWACHIPLEEEGAAKVVNDSVDLTPYVREDILLGLPQHPLCKADCAGLKIPAHVQKKLEAPVLEDQPSPWDVLDKLKLK